MYGLERDIYIKYLSLGAIEMGNPFWVKVVGDDEILLAVGF